VLSKKKIGKIFFNCIYIDMNKKIKKLTMIEYRVLNAVLENGVYEELFNDDKKEINAYLRALEKIKQLK